MYENKYVLVRTYSAGVHLGTLVSLEDTRVILKDARRLWYWSGAFTLNAVAEKGIDFKNSKISIAVPEIVLTQAIEVIPITENLIEVFKTAKEYTP